MPSAMACPLSFRCAHIFSTTSSFHSIVILDVQLKKAWPACILLSIAMTPPGPMKQRIFGLENEYGLIFSPNGRIYLPMEKVLGYIFEGLIPNSWPSNAFLVNGARFYQDTGCHPEYSTPECDNILELVVHDKAGERLLEACLPAAEERLREEGLSGEIYIFKNNTDSLGNTYGCHENFLMRRDVDFWKVTEQLIPFFVTRQIYTGAGKVLKVSGKPQFFISAARPAHSRKNLVVDDLITQHHQYQG